jgi:hypothetical protein
MIIPVAGHMRPRSEGAALAKSFILCKIVTHTLELGILRSVRKGVRMSVRSLSVVVAGLLVLLAGCSGGGDTKVPGGVTGTSGQQAQQSSDSTPTYRSYEDFPGPEIIYNDGNPVGMRMKPIDTMWTTELAGVPAPSGKHYVAVYVVVTGEDADRGVKDTGMGNSLLQLKGTHQRQVAHPASQLEQLLDVADGKWRDATWEDTGLGFPMDKGETMVGVLGFALSDTLTATSFELCTPQKDDYLSEDTFPCIPVPDPGPRR